MYFWYIVCFCTDFARDFNFVFEFAYVLLYVNLCQDFVVLRDFVV